MAAVDRLLLFNFRISEEERAKLSALAEDEDMPASIYLRRIIRQRYDARFGEAPPKAAGGGKR